MNDATALISGGLAGAVLTLIVQFIHRASVRPRIVILFGNNVAGCRVETPAISISGGQALRQVYLRLRVENRGWTYAKNLSVCVSRIDYPTQTGQQEAFDEEVVDLGLALTGDRIFNLAAGGHRFVDLIHTQGTGAQQALVSDFKATPIRLAQLGFDRGTYQFRVFASAENAESVDQFVRFSWDGTRLQVE